MAYIGRQLARGENKLFDDISSSFNGSTTTFTLAVSSVATATATPYQLFVSLGGVMQKPNTDFTTAGNQITFTTAPAAGLSCWIMMQGDTIDQAAIPDASVTPSKISGSNFAFSGDLRLKDADGSHYVGFASPSTVSTNKVWTLPAADGSASQYLQTNGSGVLTWATVSIGGATGIDFNDNVKARWGTGNDLSVYHNGTDSYIDNVTGNLILRVNTNEKAIVGVPNGATELYHNDVKKFETSSAGVSITGALTVSTNATITGDLTVSGTTTTINTQTLDVEDKNVVIGKVSSPSDTTADGGGWTLKGASDKTFNWVNSTDAWTSSEHIHLGDNKKLLLGTGADLEIFFDGTHSKIVQTAGTNCYLASDSIILSNAAISKYYATATANGAVDLYHNNSKKFETTSGGINVTGAINVNGAALSTAPTINATANGSISANEAVIVESDGKVAGITAVADATTSSANLVATANSNYGPRWLQTTWDDANSTVVAVWYEHTGNSGQSRINIAAGTLSGTSLTWGSNVVVYTGTARWPQVASLGSNKYVVTWAQDNGQSYGRIATVSGTTVTLHSTQNDGLSNYYNDSDLIALSSTKAVLAYAHGANDDNYVKVITISGNSLSFGSATIFTGSNTNGGFNRLEKISSTKCLWTCYRAPFATVYGRILDISSSATTPTMGGIATFIDNKGYGHLPIWDSVKEQGAFLWQHTGRSNKICALKWTFSGSTLTVNINTITNDLVDGDYQAWEMQGAISNTSNIFITLKNQSSAGGGSNQGEFFKVVQDGDTFSSSNNVQNYSSGDYVMSADNANQSSTVQLAGANKFLVLWGTYKSGTNYLRYFVRQYPATDLTTENFIGFSSAAYTNGQTATINVTGNTTTQSSLTPGQKYYIQNNGSLALTADDPSVAAGRALTATSLLINTGD